MTMPDLVSSSVPELASSIVPDLGSYDLILVNTSAGKDSQAMLDYVVELARAAGVLDRIELVHCDLGRMEWSGTRELAEEHARHYGLPLHVVARDRDLLHQVEHERGMWPDSARRYCTSDQKTSQVAKLITRRAREIRRFTVRAPRVLNCLGMRAEESPARAKKVPFGPDGESNSAKHVDRWLPLHTWTLANVWARVRAAGTRPHPAYAAGMPRLSCRFCVLASRSALVLSARLNPELAAEYAAVEKRIGHTFKTKLSMAEIVAEAAAGGPLASTEDWRA
jgi:3'-phosphoadenosine 5'-phosphosulfate sulfotransferase (PAPS reductase)/FAD synthetase